jgi:UDP-3-O-[3-hydroxymyristoyl] N-acetylglucosamine deacetylase
VYQTTLKKPLVFSGVGLHTGSFIKVKILPTFANQGIQFIRSDKKESQPIKISPFNVFSTQLATTLKCGDFPISTIEHVLSALYGMGVDNAIVQVDGPEVPILDGSAFPIVELICDAGIETLKQKRKYLKVKKKIRIEKDSKWIEIIPSRFFKTTFHISFDNSLIKEQKVFFNVTTETFKNEIAKARTFGFKKDVEELWKMGLAKGGSLDNAVVVDGNKIMNPEGLRFYNEFVRHKTLDLIGDIALVGYRIFGHIRASKSGHQLNNLFARALLESTNCYSIIELSKQPKGEKENGLRILEPQGI